MALGAWYSVFGPQQLQVVLVRDKTNTGYDIALVTTDLAATPAQIIERYADRWSIEVAIEDAKQTIGVGQARNRVRRAVERTVPFELIVGTLTICWYATAGHHPDDVETTRSIAPRYRTKTHPSVADMAAKLRRVIIAAQFRQRDPTPPTPTEINLRRLAWEDAAAQLRKSRYSYRNTICWTVPWARATVDDTVGVVHATALAAPNFFNTCRQGNRPVTKYSSSERSSPDIAEYHLS